MTELEPEHKARQAAHHSVPSGDQQELARFHSASVTDVHTRDWRKAALIVLIHHFCSEHGLSDTAAALREEARVQINEYSVCDNIDLESILTDYEAFYFHKFRKKIKMVRHQPSPLFNLNSAPGPAPAIKNNLSSRSSSNNKILARVRSKSARPRISPAPSQPAAANGAKLEGFGFSNKKGTAADFSTLTPSSRPVNNDPTLQLLGCQPNPKNMNNVNPVSEKNLAFVNLNYPANISSSSNDCIIPPTENNLSNYTEEWRELSRQIARDLVTHDLGVTMDDVVGMDDAKQILREAIIYPRKYPEMFSALGCPSLGRHFEPWRGLLLHGPPGTGKTMLAKAVASEAGLPFFNVTVSTIVSKWRGDSEKAIRVLFDMARMRAPSIIFIDEIDALGGRRNGHEQEATRRMKTELLVQLDGLLHNAGNRQLTVSSPVMNLDDDLDVVGGDADVTKINSASRWNHHVFVLAASNMAWDIDPALLRRLEKQVFVDFPNASERLLILQKFFGTSSVEKHAVRSSGIVAKDLDYQRIGEATEGFSGAHIHLACKEAVMKSLREAVAGIQEELKRKNQQRRTLSGQGTQHKREAKLNDITTEAMLKAAEEIRTSADFLTKAGGCRERASYGISYQNSSNCAENTSYYVRKGCSEAINHQESMRDD